MDKNLFPGGGQFGYDPLDDNLYSEVAAFISSAAITAKRVVVIDSDGRVAQAATDSTASLSVGVALNPASAADQPVRVVREGFVSKVPASGAIAHGNILKRSTATAGAVEATASPAVGEAIGFAVGSSSSNLVNVWVCKSL